MTPRDDARERLALQLVHQSGDALEQTDARAKIEKRVRPRRRHLRQHHGCDLLLPCLRLNRLGSAEQDVPARRETRSLPRGEGPLGGFDGCTAVFRGRCGRGRSEGAGVWAADGKGCARARWAAVTVDENGSEMNVGHVEIEIGRGADVDRSLGCCV